MAHTDETRKALNKSEYPQELKAVVVFKLNEAPDVDCALLSMSVSDCRAELYNPDDGRKVGHVGGVFGAGYEASLSSKHFDFGEAESHFDLKYHASAQSIWEAVTQALEDNGIALTPKEKDNA